MRSQSFMAPPSKTNSFPVKNNDFPCEDCSNLKVFYSAILEKIIQTLEKN